jgi:hypothetical protein
MTKLMSALILSAFAAVAFNAQAASHTGGAPMQKAPDAAAKAAEPAKKKAKHGKKKKAMAAKKEEKK